MYKIETKIIKIGTIMLLSLMTMVVKIIAMFTISMGTLVLKCAILILDINPYGIDDWGFNNVGK